MNWDTHIPNRKLALPIAEQLSVQVIICMSLAKTKQLTLMESLSLDPIIFKTLKELTSYSDVIFHKKNGIVGVLKNG
jgi:hypothetical protein